MVQGLDMDGPRSSQLLHVWVVEVLACNWRALNCSPLWQDVSYGMACNGACCNFFHSVHLAVTVLACLLAGKVFSNLTMVEM